MTAAEVTAAKLIAIERSIEKEPITKGGDNVLTGENTFSGLMNFTGIPTADPAVVGALWADIGVLTISAG